MSQSVCRFNIVLVEPEIPPNTGNIARLCAATNSKLHLIEPLGFELNDKQLKIVPNNIYTLEETSLALDNFLQRKNVGKTVIKF